MWRSIFLEHILGVIQWSTYIDISWLIFRLLWGCYGGGWDFYNGWLYVDVFWKWTIDWFFSSPVATSCRSLVLCISKTSPQSVSLVPLRNTFQKYETFGAWLTVIDFLEEYLKSHWMQECTSRLLSACLLHLSLHKVSIQMSLFGTSVQNIFGPLYAQSFQIILIQSVIHSCSLKNNNLADFILFDNFWVVLCYFTSVSIWIFDTFVFE